ncbi:MAG: Trk family potassium uptake protein, partial [Pyramidobacter sp.]|nr:Trk family potassium uptake protein [Pyramidobacter sp.]
MEPKRKRMSATRRIVLLFLGTILIGTLLLCLPISAKSREWTPCFHSLFTATSATCVTGLTVFDTCTHWSLFGQIVILIMIQCGGLGVMTTITMFAVFAKRRISLYERKLLMQSEGTMRTGGVIKLLKRVVAGTFLFEGCGAILLAFRFCADPRIGFWRGLFYAVFHAVSAFCNAGFDLMGRLSPGSSLTLFANDVLVNLTISVLIIIGGIGFFVWDDILQKKLKFKTYTLQSKLVLTVSAALILFGWVFFFLFEQDSSLAGLGLGQKLLTSLFQSITARTAGFFTTDLSKLSVPGNLLMTALMFVGGSPGSTAGGVKTTTCAVILVMAASAVSHRDNPAFLGRRIPDGVLHKAVSVVVINLGFAVAGALILCLSQPLPLTDIL